MLDNDDGRLTPSVEAREKLIGLIRSFSPDLLLGLRPVDYHADHRAAGQLVMDASYLLTVPLVRPDVPALARMPVICHTYDHFQKPMPFQADVAVAVDQYFEQKVRMLACHESQFFEWLPFNAGGIHEVPRGEAERREWLKESCKVRFAHTAGIFRRKLAERYGARRARQVKYAEVFEICEYGRQPDKKLIEELFPQ